MKRKISIILVLTMLLSTLLAIDVFALDQVKIEEGTYILESKLGKNMVMDVDNASKKSGANIQLYKNNGTSAQLFSIKKSGSYYTITPVCSGLKVTVKKDSLKTGENVWQYKNEDSDAQKWRFYDAGDGYCYIRCKVGAKVLDVKGGKSANGTNIQMWNLNQTKAQKWKLKKVISSKRVKIKGCCYDILGRNEMQKYARATLYSDKDEVLGSVQGKDGYFILNCSITYPDNPSYIIFDTKVDGYKACGVYKLTNEDKKNIANSKEIFVADYVYIGYKYNPKTGELRR